MSGDNADDDGFETMSRRKPKKSNTNKPTNRRQRRSGNNYTGKRPANNDRRAKKAFSGGPSLSGWSKPSDGWSGGDTTFEEEEKIAPIATDDKDPIDVATEVMESVVQTEISQASTADEKINAALASTAAAATMASLMNSMGFETRKKEKEQQQQLSKQPATITNFASFAKGQNMGDLLGDLGERDPHWKEKQFPKFADEDVGSSDPEPPSAPSFAAFCKGQSTSALLTDFGEADPKWKEKVIVEEDSKSSTKKETQQNTPSTQKQAVSHSKLAPHGKAAIHLSIESFGVVHGAPSRGARDRSGSPHTKPLEWLDVGDSITDPVPEHLDFHDGLRSGVIKRMLKTAPLVVEETKNKHGWDDDDDDDDSSIDLQSVRDFSAYCREHLAGNKIFPSLLEAIHEGGHGYVNPLTMRFSIGSNLGRHRSVVATEWVAQQLRYLLRNHNEKILSNSNKNDKTKHPYTPKDRRPITCTVSVGTVHRDVNKRIPQKHYKEDDEDYVDKNDRL